MNADRNRTQRTEDRGQRSGFTLIELLVVIAIIGILTALVMGLLPRAANAKVRARVKAELAQLETAVESYKEKRGFYPPDNPKDAGANSLYYELSGTTFSPAKGIYTILSDAGSSITAASVSTAFGAGGIVNSTADEAKNFYPALKASQARDMKVNGVMVKVLGIAVKGPTGDFCPWFYNSSTPAHNPNGYDLWVDVILNGQTKRFGNWKED